VGGKRTGGRGWLVVADAPADVFGEGDVSGRVASGVVNSPTDRAPPQRLPSRARCDAEPGPRNGRAGRDAM
jgi:hypothetical protein